MTAPWRKRMRHETDFFSSRGENIANMSFLADFCLFFLVMFPLGLIGISAAIGFVERSKPVRAFVVIDQAKAYTDDIDREVDYRY